MKTAEILSLAGEQLATLSGHIFDVLTISKPVSRAAASNLAKVISKLSPLLGNLIEFNAVELLNTNEKFRGLGHWRRQDPGFPDTVFQSAITPTPGIEFKTWFPLATEITARFKDSQMRFVERNIQVALLAWLPEYILYGKPRIIAVSVIDGHSLASARDTHYHNPPDYLVLEPEDTTLRTRNLQQTTTNGHKWQGTPEQFAEAEDLVQSWGSDARHYQPTRDYQLLLRELIARYPYRLDTNYAKINRIEHPEIRHFKGRVYRMPQHNLTIQEWMRLCAHPDDESAREAFSRYLGITDGEADDLVQ
jgi:hypothetical protein